jgi:SAM-dependent methyltransferase
MSSGQEDQTPGSQDRRRFDGGQAEVDAILLPETDRPVAQDVEWCEVVCNGARERVRFHDYDRIFEIPGLYERIFYDILRCKSPQRVVAMLGDVMEDSTDGSGDLRVIDVGAGNGIVGERLASLEPEHLVGLDILEEAQHAARRDRPDVYDEYLVADLTELEEETAEALDDADLNCLTSVATLGFNDIPPAAFAAAADFVEPSGWLAFNLKEDFLRPGEDSGFARLIRGLQSAGAIRIEAYRRYRHRMSVNGRPLHYVAMVARKLADFPAELVEEASAVGRA